MESQASIILSPKFPGRGGVVLEPLESRLFCSVETFVEGGRLIVRGGDGDDSAVIFRGSDRTTFQVSASTAGEVVAQLIQTFQGVTRGIRIDMGAGNDSVVLQGIRVLGTIEVNGGAGDDELVVRSSRPSGHLIWRGGDGTDSILIRKSTIQGNLILDGGGGRDRTYLSFVHVRCTADISDVNGPSIITFTRLSVDGDAKISTGASLDRLTIHDSTFKTNSKITTSRGDDRIRVRGTVFRRTPTFDPGAGENFVDRELILGWDFNDGQQGWEPGFADYNPTFNSEQELRLLAEIRPAPEESGFTQDFFILSGENLSDDLLMYLTRPLSGEDGLLPDQEYRVEFIVRYLTNRPLQIFGHIEWLKVGAAGHEIERVIDPDTGSWTINISRGNQAVGGTDASVVGLVYNGLTETIRWRKVGNTHVHPELRTTDSEGRLWLFVGIEAAFEAGSGVNLASVSVKVTPVFNFG